MKFIKSIDNIVIFFFLTLSSILISYTYYFDHFALVNALIQNNDVTYDDKTNIFFLIHFNSPSFLFVIINFFIKIGFSITFINSFLTFFATLLNLTGIYLISKFITSSKFLSILISLTAIILVKNFGDIDYPTLIFSGHTIGVYAYSLCTFILGLLTLRNLLFAILTCLLLLSFHMILGLWMFGIISLSAFLFIKKKNIKKILVTIFILLIVIIFYINWFANNADIPFEFNQKDYDNYFFYLEAHRNNYGDLGNLYFDYVIKTIVLFLLILIYLRFNFNNISDYNNNFLLKTLSISIILSGIIFFIYKIFPQIFPEITVKTIPQRFFLIHSVVGYPIIISILYKLLENFFVQKKLNKNLSFYLISTIILLHLIQHHEHIKSRFDNIKTINENKKQKNLFWNKVEDLKLKDYILTSNYLCNETIIYTKLPILFCFHPLDYIPYFPKLVSPTKKITEEILGISYKDLEYKHLSGINELEIKKIYENKSLKEWIILKKEFNFNTIIVPKEWNLNLNLIINDKYKVYQIE